MGPKRERPGVRVERLGDLAQREQRRALVEWGAVIDRVELLASPVAFEGNLGPPIEQRRVAP